MTHDTEHQPSTNGNTTNGNAAAEQGRVAAEDQHTGADDQHTDQHTARDVRRRHAKEHASEAASGQQSEQRPEQKPERKEAAARPGVPFVTCPQCGAGDLCPRRPEGLKDRLMGLVGQRLYRCNRCGARLYRRAGQ